MWTRTAKFKAEQRIKNFKIANPNYQLFTVRPNIESFASYLRESHNDMKRHIWQKYVNTLRIKKLSQFEPTFAAFKGGIFLDEKYSFEKGRFFNMKLDNTKAITVY